MNLPISFPLRLRTRHELAQGLSLLIAFASIACICPAEELNDAKPTTAISPLFHEATNQFGSMQTTLYQYRTQVDRDAGSYKYDCVGFVSYALKQATPEAWASTVKVTGIPKGRIPSPVNNRNSSPA